MTLLPGLSTYIKANLLTFDSITAERKQLLSTLAEYVVKNKNKDVLLNFICTHNSRRSHISQLWAQAAAAYYHLQNVTCYSGGTEATAFNTRAVNAMREVGFNILQVTDGGNPVYKAFYTENDFIKVYSKTYDAPENPSAHFCAVMTCSHADENCPFIPGAEKRVALTYDDPKEFDGTPLEASKYAERVKEIGVEIFYAFYLAQAPGI